MNGSNDAQRPLPAGTVTLLFADVEGSTRLLHLLGERFAPARARMRELVRKAAAGRADEINTCIACNQACLDHTFVNKRASCLVNPRACRETELVLLPLPSTAPAKPRPTVAVVGAGPAGLSAATSAKTGRAPQ